MAEPDRPVLASPFIVAPEPPLTIGVEEEYMLVDPETRDLVSEPAPALWTRLEESLPGQVSPEFLKAQVEVGTRAHRTVADAAAELKALRRTVVRAAEEEGHGMIAASTHPFAVWGRQKTTDRARYAQLHQDIGTPVRRLMISAMHVHIGIDDDDLRVDLMNQVKYFLPHLLALATSSPFWQGEETGLMSYRLAVFNELPRTGMPEMFDSFSDFQRHVDTLVGCGVIEDATKIWWDVRPSARFPTLEMRICDIPTRVTDAIAIAALFQALVRMLWRLKRNNVQWRRYKNLLIDENRWRAARYGLDEGLIDFGRTTRLPVPDLLEEILALTAEDAEALGSTDLVAQARDIPKRGTGAHRQLQIFREALSAGAGRAEALVRVVDDLRAQTVADL